MLKPLEILKNEISDDLILFYCFILEQLNVITLLIELGLYDSIISGVYNKKAGRKMTITLLFFRPCGSTKKNKIQTKVKYKNLICFFVTVKIKIVIIPSPFIMYTALQVVQ